LTDGGLIANNPTEFAITHAHYLWDSEPSIVVSLGTGISSPNKVSNSPLYWANQVARKVSDSEAIHKRVKKSKKRYPYHRLNVDGIGEIGLDDTDPKSFDILVKDTQKYCSDNDELFKLISFQLIALRKF
jgi:hypothetical protein